MNWPPADLLHHRDRDRSGGSHIGGGMTRDHAEESAGHDRDLGRAAPFGAEEGIGEVIEKIADPGPGEERTESDEEQGVGGGNLHRRAEDPILAEHRPDDAPQGVAAMAHVAGEIVAKKGITHGEQGDDDERVPGNPADALQDGDR
jgi:hypothetical protein